MLDVGEPVELARNDVELSAAELGAAQASATDGNDASVESARDPTTNADSLSTSPVLDGPEETGFYKVESVLCTVQLGFNKCAPRLR